jgi:oxidase EvaA
MINLPEKILGSLLADNCGPGGSIEEILAWLKQRNREVCVRITPTPFRKLTGWSFEPVTGNLVHDSGKFFSIEGLRVQVDDGRRREWTQPIINQPEVGFLGILAKEIDGVLCFLLQAKIEPGNVNHVQLSPTLQATRSNYTQVHKGRKPQYLEFFQNALKDQIILDQLQSEQGARFLRKRNRNIILKVDEAVPAHDDFRWLTLGQIKALMAVDNVVNMDTRTVVSGLRFNSLLNQMPLYGHNQFMASHAVSPFGRDLLLSELAHTGYRSIDGILFWLSDLKARYELLVDRIPLREVREWQVTEDEIARPDRRFFRVLGVEVTIDNREVRAWCQPLVEPMQEGICAFIIKKIAGVYHFLVQAKVECGNFDVVEMAPTVQCLTGDYRQISVATPTFLDYVLRAVADQVVFDTKQSEEGGRFYNEQNRNLLVEAGDDFPVEVPDNFMWLTLGQIKEFLRFNNYLNIQARSLIAALDYR